MTDKRVALAGKKPLKELLAHPANYETPLEYFRSTITPNDAFYIRSHGIPPRVEPRDWRLEIGGDAAERRVSIVYDELRALPPVEITAVCYCAGNRRSYFEPKAPGVQWGDGGMGSAVWKGARLKDVLAMAGATPRALELHMTGADEPATEAKAPFVKCLPMGKADDDNVLIAYEMNGAPLPVHNGAPLRMVVPGWTATYWVKHLASLRVSSEPFTGHWMRDDYRVPRGRFGVEHFETQGVGDTEAITEIQVNSLIADVSREGDTIEISGLAWDAGHGIAQVTVSIDEGATWTPAELCPEECRFGYRTWTSVLRSRTRGEVTVMSRATDLRGHAQPLEAIPNPPGYYYNAVQRLVLA